MTATQSALTDLLVAAGVDLERIGDSPDGDTVVVERDGDERIVVGYDWSEGAEMGADGWPTWVDFTPWNADDEPGATDGAEPTAAAQRIAALVGA